MAKSISQAQADLLSSDFLNKIGSKEDFKPTKSLSALLQVAGKIVEEAQNNLNKVDKVASGGLSDSIKIIDPIKSGKTIVCDITAMYYWKFIDKGVNGTKNKFGSPFSFKDFPPGGAMVEAIKKWLKKEGLKAKAKGQGKPITKREKFRKSISDIESASWAIGVSVKKKGLKKTNFMTNAINEGKKSAKQLLGSALAVDIMESIPKKLN